MIRIVRIVKLLRLKQFQAFNRLINTLLFSLPTIMNVMALLFMNYFIFAVIGVFLFKDAKVDPKYKSDVLSFQNFHMSLNTLFRCSTGEDWPLVMYNYGKAPGLYLVARIYFLIYTLVTIFIMLNLIELVLVSIFDNFYFDKDNTLIRFE